ncbi:MAG: hypothetical protein K2W33_19325 [Burkholderiales bacterium]|nr:hypothetical protein [Burkholderiales bacterium]
MTTRKTMQRILGIAALCGAVAGAWAQVPAVQAEVVPQADVPQSFPDGATVPTAPVLKAALAERTFRAKYANGAAVRYEYKGGYLYVDAARGRDSGAWRVEDGKMCVDFRGAFPSGCAEARMRGDAVWFKRATTGEVVQLVPD